MSNNTATELPMPETPRMHRPVSINSMQMKGNIPPETAVFPKPRKSSLIKKAIADWVVLLLLGLSILFFNLFAKAYHRGFNCDDDSLRYPYLPDTITTSVLITYSLLIPVLTILVNEFFVVRRVFSKDGANSFTGSADFWLCLSWQWYLNLTSFLLTVATSQMITEISKYSIGRLRPHFIDLCWPKVDNDVIKRDTLCTNPHAYITDYECTNPDALPKWLNDVHLSFMSGHSSFSSVCLIYLVLYLQCRFHWIALGMVKPLYQAGLVFLVFYTGMSRISDYKHHWSDVMTGLIQGSLVAIIMAVFVSDLMQRRSLYKTPSNAPDEGSSRSPSKTSGLPQDSNV